jgi:hypothetical protein
MIKPKTKAEKLWLSDVASLGCAVCRNSGFGESPAEVHHVRNGVGKGQRASHFDTIPLCPTHHRTGGHGLALHAGRRTFEQNYGTELALMWQTKREVTEMRKNRIGGAE